MNKTSRENPPKAGNLMNDNAKHPTLAKSKSKIMSVNEIVLRERGMDQEKPNRIGYYRKGVFLKTINN